MLHRGAQSSANIEEEVRNPTAVDTLEESIAVQKNQGSEEV